MGLDMYLEAELLLPGYEHNTRKEKATQAAVLRAAGLPKACDVATLVTLSVTVAYWRKANHIHYWFVQNVQDGRDECQKSYVSREKLRELLNLCRQVLSTVECVEGDVNTGRSYYPEGTIEQHTKRGQIVAQKGITEKLLPTAEGFFFGSTDYDEFYIDDTKTTVTMLESVLNNTAFDKCEFSYQASW